MQKRANSKSGAVQLTCYFRHFKKYLKEMSVEITKENKREIDKAIHNFLDVEYKDCSTTWKEIKKRLAEDEVKFTSSLKKALASSNVNI